MSILLRYIWVSKVCLTGWSAYKACTGENANMIICFLSGSYFFVLVFATLVGWKSFHTIRKIDGMEGDYLRCLEEGLTFHDTNRKQE
jgi:hypothetical protein